MINNKKPFDKDSLPNETQERRSNRQHSPAPDSIHSLRYVSA